MSCAKGLRYKNEKTARWLLPRSLFSLTFLQIPHFSGLASCSFVQRSLNGYCLLLEKTALSECSGLLSQIGWRRYLSFSEPHTQHVPANVQTNLAKQQPCRDRDLGRQQINLFPASTESSKGVHLTAHHLIPETSPVPGQPEQSASPKFSNKSEAPLAVPGNSPTNQTWSSNTLDQ